MNNTGVRPNARYQEFLSTYKSLNAAIATYDRWLKKVAGMVALQGTVPQQYLDHLSRVEKEVSRLTVAFKVSSKQMLDEMQRFGG